VDTGERASTSPSLVFALVTRFVELSTVFLTDEAGVKIFRDFPEAGACKFRGYSLTCLIGELLITRFASHALAFHNPKF